jgi:hypothetical protein
VIEQKQLRSKRSTGEEGTVLRVNRYGHEDKPQAIANWPIARLIGGVFPNTARAVLLGLSSNAKREPFAIGLTDKLEECWNYPLPAGAHQKPIEPITSSHVLPGHEGEWWLAGPDGSIHLVTEDGRFFDSFHHGAALTGFAAGKLGERSVLLVSTDEGLAAWELKLPTEAKRRREF